ncbi:NeuD/PglB/VioB family sugar acetyltransferase [Lysinibacillus sp. BW-2-10]|uniref:NeuD/PglB/VioB family sugar acetyltransferase n=1 Tax=Lysinibacillus sp. BW-2-10 TaxID=2590030 RepID=UPI0011802035|nr:NeuD/PglB/VioB family sugar acetyltransferase [Lysinibacillus sp. BW-2-10]TSI04306.1 sugar O-acyltransferase [Lysinibacillus sp. BW-2-10]
MIKKIIILGTGGNCIDILDTINEINEVQYSYHCIGFLDDNPNKWGKSFFGVDVLGPLTDANKYTNDCYFISGIGSERNFFNKEKIILNTKIPLERFETIIHPTASVSKMAYLGKGNVIFQNVTITSNVKIGNHAIMLPNSVINHDVNIGDYTCIASGVNISGGVVINKSCYLGTNSSIIGNVEIGEFSLIGMGSNVLTDVDRNSVMIGNPAIKLRNTI